MSWRTRLGQLAAEFGEDVVQQASRVLARDATEAQARKTLERIVRTVPEGVDFAVKPPQRILYRGTTGSDLRVSGGIGEGFLFASPHEDVARLYGDAVERIAAKPNARILTEGTPQFAAVTGRKKGPLLRTMRKGENLKTAADDAIAKAKAAGFDAVEFNSMRDLGTAILNEDAFLRNWSDPDIRKARGGLAVKRKGKRK